MKKIMGLVFILVMILSTSAFGEIKVNEDIKEEKIGGYCPVTQIKGESFECFKCHTEKTFKIKEVIPFEFWELPTSSSKMILIDGFPIGVYELHGFVGGAEGTEINKFFEYLHSNHKEVTKVIFDIHSGGGSLFGGYQIVGVMKYWQSKGYIIETRINGFAASAAFFVFCAGNPRSVSPQAELMWHELITFSMFDMSGPADKEDQAQVLRHLQDTANEMISEISNLTKKELDSKIRKKEYWINGRQAFEFGFATKILE